VTEAAGPTVTIASYYRGLNQSYQMEFQSSQSDRSVNFKRNSQVALGGGAPDVLFHRSDKLLTVTTQILSELQMGQFREIIGSVGAGETLTFDRYGTIAAPNDPQIMVLESDSYQEQRATQVFDYRVTFTLRYVT
jgi:hypothetical protein